MNHEPTETVPPFVIAHLGVDRNEHCAHLYETDMAHPIGMMTIEQDDELVGESYIPARDELVKRASSWVTEGVALDVVRIANIRFIDSNGAISDYVCTGTVSR